MTKLFRRVSASPSLLLETLANERGELVLVFDYEDSGFSRTLEVDRFYRLLISRRGIHGFRLDIDETRQWIFIAATPPIRQLAKPVSAISAGVGALSSAAKASGWSASIVNDFPRSCSSPRP